MEYGVYTLRTVHSCKKTQQDGWMCVTAGVDLNMVKIQAWAQP